MREAIQGGGDSDLKMPLAAASDDSNSGARVVPLRPPEQPPARPDGVPGQRTTLTSLTLGLLGLLSRLVVSRLVRLVFLGCQRPSPGREQP